MKLISEYLERAIDFEKMAEDETDSKFKKSLLEQALAYRKLAVKRAKLLNLPTGPLPSD